MADNKRGFSHSLLRPGPANYAENEQLKSGDHNLPQSSAVDYAAQLGPRRDPENAYQTYWHGGPPRPDNDQYDAMKNASMWANLKALLGL